MDVKLAETWDEVEAATARVSTCIRPTGANWDRARRTWADCSKRLRYFILEPEEAFPTGGYIRLLQYSTLGHTHQTWLVEFIHPKSYEFVQAVQRQMDVTLLVKAWDIEDKSLTANWPKITVPCNLDYPYQFHSKGESTWLVVLPVVEEGLSING